MDTESMDSIFLPAGERPSLKSSYNRDKRGGMKLRPRDISLFCWDPCQGSQSTFQLGKTGGCSPPRRQED